MAYWLMKAEPDSRIAKGKDVKFSVDDFEAVGTTAWEGVRNHEAKNLMREMALGDRVLFYHSNCKTPGIAGFAEVSKLAYPDYSAWDSSHPYFDPKSDKDSPRWYMVDVSFSRRASHFVSLALLKSVAASGSPPKGAEYIGDAGAKAITEMPLVGRGRLSVQRVSKEAWDAVEALATNGGWDEEGTTAAKKKGGEGSSEKKETVPRQVRKRKAAETVDAVDEGSTNSHLHEATKKKGKSTRSAKEETPVRRSTRTKK